MFRKEALEYKNKMMESKVMMLPAIPSIYYVLFALVVFLLTFYFLIFESYTRRINVTGEVIVKPFPIILSAPREGLVRDIFSKKGAQVKEGQDIFIIADPQYVENNAEIFVIKEKKLTAQIEHYKKTLSNLDSQLIIAKKNLDNLRNTVQIYEKLVKEKAISKTEYIDRFNLYQSKQQDYEELTNRKEQTFIKIKDLEMELVNNHHNKITVIKSPINGIVESIDVTEKQMINSNKSLGTINPLEKNISLIYWLPNDAIPYLKIGDEVKIRYNAFPYEKFGQFKGIISSIATIPASASEISLYKKNIDVKLDLTNPLYKVEVQIDQTSIDVKNVTFEFFNGMQTETTFYLEKRAIYQWILSPLYYAFKK